MGWKLVVAAGVLLVAQTAGAQSDTGSLVGRVVGPDGAAVADVPIRAVNAAAGTDARTYSSATGRYELPNLPGESTSSRLRCRVARSLRIGTRVSYSPPSPWLPIRAPQEIASRFSRLGIPVQAEGHFCKWVFLAPTQLSPPPAATSLEQVFWTLKLLRNVVRDRETRRKLRSLGWGVMTVWECEARRPSLPARLRRFLGNNTRRAVRI